MSVTASPYLRLMRLDRPVGTLLLLWPTLAALWLAADGMPPLLLVLVFSLGTLFMRSAGCVINDIADRKWDHAVKRTADRPLTTGELPLRNALLLLVGLALGSASLLLFLNVETRWLALGGFAVAVIYPFMKRWTYLPQVVLGAAFSWGLLMAYSSIHGSLSREAGLLFIASVFWIVAYDTLYAMVDRDDDVRVGIKSTAILFGTADRLIVGLLQLGALGTLVLLGAQRDSGTGYFAGLAVMAALFCYQQYLVRGRDRFACLDAFRNNILVGFAFFAGVVTDTQIAPWVATLKQAATS